MRREIIISLCCLLGILGVLIWWPVAEQKTEAPRVAPYSTTIGSGTRQDKTVGGVLGRSPSRSRRANRSYSGSSASSATPNQASRSSSSAGSAARRASGNISGSVYIQGDSLSSDIGPRLKNLLPEWQIELSAQVGRHLQTGLDLLRRKRAEGSLPEVVVFALGTNDWDYPMTWHKSRLVKAMEAAGKERCVVIPTVWADGQNRPAFNKALQSLAAVYGPKRLQVMPWSEAVGSGQVDLADGTHPRDWRVRSRLMAASIKRCASGA